ncbi:MAG: DUF975 family protein [Treponema sp.]|nr:DUF975 family protein [Treponema sp.]
MKTGGELRALARGRLRGGWLAAVGVALVYGIFICLSGGTVAGLLVLGGPLTLGFYGYFVGKSRGERVQFECLFEGFRCFGSALLVWLLQGIFLTLWTCLFVIPGIVKYYSYSMSFYILRDDPGIGAAGAITASRKMMNGHKGRLFCLDLSFIGWVLLSCLTLGIGFLWLIPYREQARAEFYEDLRGGAGYAVLPPEPAR